MQEMTYSKSTEHLTQMLQEKIKPGVPSFFRLRAQLPAQGRTDTPIAASERMTVVLKAYAGSGENELHAHTDEDHVFFVLQGEATFQGPSGEIRVISAQEGVMLPRGTFYSFRATSVENLVMIRVGTDAHDGADRTARVGMDGKPVDGFSHKNHELPVILSGKTFGEPRVTS
jgi:mannose-6-phosphate isomerase-like protein (cupin superfamily)